MGQRHQIYIRLPKKFYNKGNVNNYPETTIGIHNQWLYGYTAIRQLKNLLSWAQNSLKSEHSPLKTDISESLDVTAAIYSVDIESGYYSGIVKLDYDRQKENFSDEVDDPCKASNNNGITIVDFTQKKPQYCFLSIGHLETIDDTKEEAYVNFFPIDALEWLELHYGTPWYNNPKLPSNKDNIKETLKFLNTFSVISSERLIKIFPKLKASLQNGIVVNKQRLPNSIKLLEKLKG